MTDVVLVQMPFAGVERPSIALGILSALLKEEGLAVRSLFPNVVFADRIGLDAYRLVEWAPLTNLIGEWLFAEAAFGQSRDIVAQERHLAACAADLQPDLLEEALEYRDLSSGEDLLREIRAATRPFVHDQVTGILDQGTRVVGCTSLFQQHTASLALLRMVKRLAPDVITVLGGANCAGVMGAATHRSFDWIDYTATGEIDDYAAEFFGSLLDGSYERQDDGLPPNILGPADRCGKSRAGRPTFAMTAALDKLPRLNYDDYFDTLSASKAGRYILPSIQFESSRGCWWGAKHHCTFCGLNANGMAYRIKSAKRVKDEMDYLASRYQTTRLSAVDNIIHPSYFRSLLPELADGAIYQIFYETKANLTRSQVQILARSGVRWIQPGIESLHDESLRLIRKGTTAMINISLLKYCLEFGVQPTWNMLVGMQGEQPNWIASVRRLLPRLFHLPPPQAVSPIRYDRFSPYFEDAESFGLVLEPFNSYAAVYFPLDQRELEDIAYYFEDVRDADSRGRTKLWTTEVRRLSQAVSDWQHSYLGEDRPVLMVADEGEELWIHDTRPSAIEQDYRLTGVVADVYRMLQQPTSLNKILERVGSSCTRDVTRDQLRRVMADFEQSGLIWLSEGRAVALGCIAVDAEMPTSQDVPPWGDVNLASLFSDRQAFLAWKLGVSKVGLDIEPGS